MKFLRSVRNKDNSRSVSIYRDDHDEFTLRFFVDNVLQSDADYFTDDEADADGTAQHFVGSAPPMLVSLTNEEFCALVGPLVKAGIEFELKLPDTHNIRWLTWNGGDAVKACFADGSKGDISMVASGCPA